MNWSSRQPPGRQPPGAPAAKAGSAASPARSSSESRDGKAAPPDASASTTSVRRVSNGLKELLGSLDGIERGELLDLGSVSQATVDFFTSRGFRLHTHDLLRGWREFLAEELERPPQNSLPAGRGAAPGPERTLGRAAKDEAANARPHGPNAAPVPAGDGEDPSFRPARFFARHLWFDS